MTQKPTIMFVAGAWHCTDTWAKLVSAMEAEQYKCASVAYPSASGDVSATFPDDVKAVRDAIVAETSQGRNVVLVVHSFGGAVGGSAIKDLTPQKSSSENDSSGHVVGLFMIATGFVETGTTFLGGFDGKPPPIWECDWDTGVATITVDPKFLFYHDLPSDEGDYWVSKLQTQGCRSFNTGAEISYSGWKDVPVWYLGTVEDKALPIEAQKFFVQTAQAQGGNVTFREIAASHSPMLSKPEETKTVLLEALAAFAQ